MNNNKRRKKQYRILRQQLIILCFTAAVLLTLIINLSWKSDTSDKAYTTAYSENNNSIDTDNSTETDNRIISENQIVPASSQNNNLTLSQEATEIYKRNKSLLILVNTENPLPDSYEFSRHTLNSGFVIDEQAYIDFYSFTKACNDAGFHYNIISAYRDRETQQGIINRNVSEFMQKGLSEAEAMEKTYETVQRVGCSEHETGLAIDLSDEKIFSLTEDLETNPTVKWFMENCCDYGFILRYPKEKVDVTGIDYEPWHFRYVGQEAAKFMSEHNLTLEEFYLLLLSTS